MTFLTSTLHFYDPGLPELPPRDYYKDFPFREIIKVVYISSWKPKFCCVFKIFSYIQNTHSGCRLPSLSLNSPQGDREIEGVEKTGGGGKGRRLEERFAFTHQHRCFSLWKPVSFQLARVHAEDLIICHITQRSSTSVTDPAGTERLRRLLMRKDRYVFIY